MKQTIEILYEKIINACGFAGAPRLVFRRLDEGQLARYEWFTSGKGLRSRTVREVIIADPDALGGYDIEAVGKILCHELAHYVCHWQCIAGGDNSRDGQRHGTRFLACWLFILRLCGGEDATLQRAADWHAERYRLSSTEATRALHAACSACSTSQAIDLAAPPPASRKPVLFWLRAAGWTALAFASANVIWQSPGTALISAGMAGACAYLIFKFKHADTIAAGRTHG